MSYHTALLKLLQVPQLGAQRIGRLLAEVDFAEFCRYDKAALKQLGWNDKQIFRWFHPDLARIEQALTWAQQRGHRLLTLFDDDYPFLLRQISTAPPLLFVKGDVANLSQPQIALVGSRDYSAYGEYWARHFSAELVKQNMVVTSGLAIGIDGFCHQQALAEGGKTVAGLGSGLAQVYPQRHKNLAQQMIECGGTLVSEFFPEQPPLAENFPRRNRIISGLSLGTLVIEATLNSGSLITARYALEQGREVFALPNGIQNPYSQGCHKLIKEGALLVESVDDILDAVALQRQPQTPPLQPGQIGLNFTAPPESHKATPTAPATLNAEQRAILAQIGYAPIAVDDIAKQSGYAIDKVLVALLDLELQALIKSVSGGYMRI